MSHYLITPHAIRIVVESEDGLALIEGLLSLAGVQARSDWLAACSELPTATPDGPSTGGVGYSIEIEGRLGASLCSPGRVLIA